MLHSYRGGYRTTAVAAILLLVSFPAAAAWTATNRLRCLLLHYNDHAWWRSHVTLAGGFHHENLAVRNNVFHTVNTVTRYGIVGPLESWEQR